MDDIQASVDHDLKICVLASGSKGNAIYISNGRASILFDAGLSGKEIERRMLARKLEPKTLTGIVVSHEHSDHIRGVGVLSRRYKLPVYITPKTAQAASAQIGKLHQTRYFECGKTFEITGLKIRPFAISHDAQDSSGFTISNHKHKVGLATDLGVATNMVKEHLKGCNLLIIEANHDMEMLINGPYPWHLKQRIKSRCGHLSNADSCNLLGELIHNNLSDVVLAHLSEQNNHPEKALNAVSQAVACNSYKLEFHVASQDISSKVIVLD
ncbi:MAG: MBL fold metallo-hydrolase [Desulfobacteraceae bacterium]|jgi:phosphoribosyl 1,2-cyclic phosphodiesterase